jgi:hypothetical protein
MRKYLYAHANPVSGWDPSGHMTLTTSEIAAVGAIIGITAAIALPSTQRIVRDFSEAAVGLAGELGESAIGRAQQAAAMAAAAATMAYSGLHEQIEKAIRDLAEELKNQLRKLKVVPISFTMMPKIAQHVQDAQGGPLRPQLLTRTTPALAKLNRAAAIAGRGPAGLGMSWDEYPFASTTAGGRGASVRAVPLPENWIQGGVIGASYALQNITPGDQFWVVVIP